MSTYYGGRHHLHATCKKFNETRSCRRESVIHFSSEPFGDRVADAARRLFDISCGSCDAPCDGAGLLLTSTLRMDSDYMAAMEIVKATFALMKTVPLETKE
jgi:hypothetical protein